MRLQLFLTDAIDMMQQYGTKGSVKEKYNPFQQ